MNFTLWLAALVAVAAPAPPAPADSAHSLMPVQASVAWGEGRYRIDSLFAVLIHAPGEDARLDRALERFRARLGARTGFGVRLGGGGLVMTVAGPGQAVQTPDENERYGLEVTPVTVSLAANTTVGALHGLETLLQLVESDSAGWYLPAVHIEDTPRFPWRGLMIDVGRHFEPVEVIQRQLDGMAAVPCLVGLSSCVGQRIRTTPPFAAA